MRRYNKYGTELEFGAPDMDAYWVRYEDARKLQVKVIALKEALREIESECISNNGNCTICRAVRLVQGAEPHKEDCPLSLIESKVE